MLDAMDNVLKLSMLLKGRTPQSVAAQRERRGEEEELHVQKAGQVKSQQWIETLQYVFSYLWASSLGTELRLDRDFDFQPNAATIMEDVERGWWTIMETATRTTTKAGCPKSRVKNMLLLPVEMTILVELYAFQ